MIVHSYVCAQVAMLRTVQAQTAGRVHRPAVLRAVRSFTALKLMCKKHKEHESARTGYLLSRAVACEALPQTMGHGLSVPKSFCFIIVILKICVKFLKKLIKIKKAHNETFPSQ